MISQVFGLNKSELHIQMLTLNKFLDRCKELTNQGYEVWIEGMGDGRWKLVIEGLQVRGDTNVKRSNV